MKPTLCLLVALLCNTTWAQHPVSIHNALSGDGTMRLYRLAIPVTKSAYEQDLDSDYSNVIDFWRECEIFVNKMFVPLGFCFDVLEDEKLVDLKDLPIGNNDLPEVIYFIVPTSFLFDIIIS